MRPRSPAEYQTDVSAAIVNVGDIVLVWSKDGGLSGVDYQQVIDHQGYDHGYLKVFLINSSGTVDISTSVTADVIHTGDSDVVDIENYVEYIIQEWESSQTFGEFQDHLDSPYQDFHDHNDYGVGDSHADNTTHTDQHSDFDDRSAAFADVPHADWYDEGHEDHEDQTIIGHSDYDDTHTDWGDHTDFTDTSHNDDYQDHSDHNDEEYNDHDDSHQDYADHDDFNDTS